MNMKYAAAIALFAAVPGFAQTAMAANAPTKADVDKVAASISGDSAKMKAYCDLSKLDAEAEAADKAKDQKKLDELSKKADDLTKALGSDYTTVMDGMQALPDNDSAKAITASLDALDAKCK